jgi:hypothetical protein
MTLGIETADPGVSLASARPAPLPDGSTMPLGAGLTFTWLRVWQIPRPTGVDYRALEVLDLALRQSVPVELLPSRSEVVELSQGPDPQPYEGMATVLEMAAGILVPTARAVEEAFEMCFDRAIELDRCLRVSQRRPSTRLTLPRAHQMVAVAMRHLDGRWEAPLQWLLAHRKLPQPEAPELLNEDELERFRTSQLLMRSGHPMVFYMDRRMQGIAAYDEGDYEEAVLWSAVAVEILLDALLSVMLWEDKVAPREAVRVLTRPLAQRVDSEYHRRLSVSAWRRIGDDPVGRWYTRLAATRNRIVHRGWVVHREEAVESIAAGEDLADYLFACVRECRERRPLTANIVNGDSIGLSDTVLVPLASVPFEKFLEWCDELDAEALRARQQRGSPNIEKE